MGPAFETFLTIAGLIALLLAALAWFGRDIWRRGWQFLWRWHEEDKILDEARKAQQVYRKQAEAEIAECLHEDTAAAPCPPTVTNSKNETTEKTNEMTHVTPGQPLQTAQTTQAKEAARQNIGQKQEK